MSKGIPQPPVPSNRQQAESWFDQLGAWGLANALAQKFAVEKAHVESVLPNASVPILPFGNSFQVVQAPQGASQPALPPRPASSSLLRNLLSGLVGAGLLGAGLAGGAYLSRPSPSLPPTSSAGIAPPAKVEGGEWLIDVELVPEKGTMKAVPRARSNDSK